MPFVIVRTRASGASVTVDAPNALLKHLKGVCTTNEDKGQGFRPFRFQWLPHSEAYRGGLEGKLEFTHMSVRKVLNTVEACGWLLLSSHSYGDSGSEYVLGQNPHATNVIGGGLPNKEPISGELRPGVATNEHTAEGAGRVDKNDEFGSTATSNQLGDGKGKRPTTAVRSPGNGFYVELADFDLRNCSSMEATLCPGQLADDEGESTTSIDIRR